jgi:Zn-dependent protease with chaperone function
MNIYIKKDDKKLGPFSKSELQEKIYCGEVSRAASACLEGGMDWVPLETLLNDNKASSATPVLLPPPIDLARLRDPAEKTALMWLYVASIPVWLVLGFYCVVTLGMPLLIIGFLWLFKLVAELWYAAYLKTNAVRISETQLPELNRIVQSSCTALRLERPEVYLIQDNAWNAFATTLFKRRMVVLFSGAVDSILLKGDPQQLSWLIGHELGHHWAGHLDFKHSLAKAGGWLIWVNLWHSRRAELTCDRVGLYCAARLKTSQLALMNATVGAQLADKVNLAEAVNQWRQHRDEFFVRYRTLYATHPHLLARLDHLNSAAAELGVVR